MRIRLSAYVTALLPLLLLTGCKTTPAAAGTPVPSVMAAPVAAATDPKSAASSKRVCRNEVATGSLMSVRVCETQAQREARDAATRDAKDKLTRPGASTCGGNSGYACKGGG